MLPFPEQFESSLSVSSTGLSQYGANELAKSRKSADEILRHYYGDEVRIG